MSWDNPFPTFNPQKPQLKRHASLDKDLGKLDLNSDPAPVSRPHTSHGHRIKNDLRSHTSHSFRGPGPEPLRDPALPQQLNDPARTNPAYQGGDRLPTDEYNSVPPWPETKPLHPHKRDHGPGGLQSLGRSNIGQPPLRSYTSPEGLPPNHSQHEARNEILNHPPPWRGAPSGMRPIQTHANELWYDGKEENDYGQDQGSHFENSQPAHGPEMSNFDAIPAPVNKNIEDQLISGEAPPIRKPAYQKRTYQSQPEPQPQPNATTYTSNAPITRQITQSPMPDFQFNLPSSSPGPGLGNARPLANPQRPGRSEQYWPHHEDQGHPPVQGTQVPPTQLPPQGTGRGPSRNQQRSASDNYGGSQGNLRQRQQRNPSDGYQRGQPNQAPSFQEGYGYGNGYGYNDGYENDGHGPQYQEMHSRPPPGQFYSNGYDSQSRAPPGQNRPMGPVSPDSLPAHPPPVRPGLMNQSGQGSRTDNLEATQASSSDPSFQQPSGQSSREVKRASPPITAYDLNLLQQRVRNNPSDHAIALCYAKKLVEAASVLANEGGRADAKATAKNRERYIFEAHKLLKSLVSAGYPGAMFYLADCHGQGLLGLVPDPKEAFSLYLSGAKLHHAPSAYRVAVCCEVGQEEGGGTRRDPLKAIQWYKRAATYGDTAAMYKMGMILLKGLLGQPRNPREAISWLKRAAEKADEENPHALHELGLLYESAAPNDAIIRDEAYAKSLFQQAAELGYKYSQFRLGTAYEYGSLGCPIDPRQSIAWYTRAAAQGEHQSELALSGWYLTGADGILQQSDTEAYLWARKAAFAGLAKAEYAMGYFSEVGIGAPTSLDDAKRWYWKAAGEFTFPFIGTSAAFSVIFALWSKYFTADGY